MFVRTRCHICDEWIESVRDLVIPWYDCYVCRRCRDEGNLQLYSDVVDELSKHDDETVFKAIFGEMETE